MKNKKKPISVETIPDSEMENGNVTTVEKIENVVITTEKVLRHGIQYRKIVSFEGCKTELEVRHIPRYASGQATWLVKFGIRDEQYDVLQMFKAKDNVPNLEVGKEVREDLFQNAVRHIGIALTRLSTIQSSLSAKKLTPESWEGEEVITVKPTEVT